MSMTRTKNPEPSAISSNPYFAWSAVCGGPKTGKTTLAKQLAEKLNRGLMSSDSFLQYARDNRPRALAQFMRGCPGKGLVVEGCEVTRLFPRLKELSLPPPDRVIFLGSTNPTDHPAPYRALVAMQIRQIREALQAGILKADSSSEPGPRVLYLPNINPKDFPEGADD